MLQERSLRHAGEAFLPWTFTCGRRALGLQRVPGRLTGPVRSPRGSPQAESRSGLVREGASCGNDWRRSPRCLKPALEMLAVGEQRLVLLFILQIYLEPAMCQALRHQGSHGGTQTQWFSDSVQLTASGKAGITEGITKRTARSPPRVLRKGDAWCMQLLGERSRLCRLWNRDPEKEFGSPSEICRCWDWERGCQAGTLGASLGSNMR